VLDHNLVTASFADGHIATASVSASIVVAIKITTFGFTVDPVPVAAVGTDADVQLGKRYFRFVRTGITPIFGGCRKRPQHARDRRGKQQFSHSNLLLPTVGAATTKGPHIRSTISQVLLLYSQHRPRPIQYWSTVKWSFLADIEHDGLMVTDI
jgi:hypothetical protein